MHTKKKILITTSFYPPYHLGGDATHCKALAEALVKKGHEVHVMFSYDAYRLKKGRVKKKEEYNGVIVHKLKSSLGGLEPILNYVFGTMPYTYNYFKKLVLKEKFDVVHHHNISLLGYKILKKIGNYKNLYTAHDYWLICPKYDLLKNWKVCAKKTCLTCCLKHKKPYLFYRHSKKWKKAISDINTIIAPSKYMKLRLEEEFNNVKHVYNFVSEIKVSNEKVKYKDYFLFAGVLEKHKGILNLLETFKKTDKNLVICGDGSLRPIIEKTTKKHKNIFYNGWTEQKELFNLMKHAKALIMPSIWPENNPMLILEAYTIGTPVIGTEYGGIPELIELNDKKLVYKNEEELLNILKSNINTFKTNKFNFNLFYEVYQEIIQ